MLILTTVKSRDLTLQEFFSILQMEYISYFVRSHIYPDKYGAKYKQYCKCKKEKILTIGDKNAILSIFTSEHIKQSYLGKFFEEYGLPNFEYRDDQSIQIMGFWDKVYWFQTGTKVKVVTEKGVKDGTITKNLSKENSAYVRVEGSITRFSYDFLSRKLTPDLTSISYVDDFETV